MKCHVKAEGEFAVAASGDYSEALCRQVIGKACLDTGCCKDKDVSGNHNMMYDWVMREKVVIAITMTHLFPGYLYKRFN